MLQGILQGIKELVFPDNCFLCHQYLDNHHQKQLCHDCLSKIELNTPPFCLKCSRPVKIFNDQGLCPSCLKTEHSFDIAWSACPYQEPLNTLIYSFKYHGKTSLKKTFNSLIVNFIDTYRIPLENFDMVMPIPLHPTRLRERGYNQAEILSQNIAQHYELTHKTDILKRSKHTQSQTSQEAKQRWTNVSDAFRISPSSSIADKSILLVDDLLTTAATANSVSRTLKNAGAAYVGVLTLSVAS